jgi:predicted nucleic acid-binding protein
MPADIKQSICYLDTTLFVYLFDTADQEKYRMARALFEHYLVSGKGRISVLVLSEWRNVMVKKFSASVDGAFRRKFIESMKSWKPTTITADMIIEADKLSERYNLSPFDSLHIQAALEGGCHYFLSEDMQNGLVINKKLTIRNPFAVELFP